jgi:hypothetical protein
LSLFKLQWPNQKSEISKEVAQSSKSCAFHSCCISIWDSNKETIETDPSESPTVIDVAEGFQSRQRHMDELILSPLISFNKTPASTIKIKLK